MVRDVIALEICEQGKSLTRQEAQKQRALAVVSILSRDFDLAQRINELLHEVAPYIVGRMGMPYREADVYIINVTVDAPAGVVDDLCAKLGLLPGVSVKATYARGALPQKEA